MSQENMEIVYRLVRGRETARQGSCVREAGSECEIVDYLMQNEETVCPERGYPRRAPLHR